MVHIDNTPHEELGFQSVANRYGLSPAAAVVSPLVPFNSHLHKRVAEVERLNQKAKLGGTAGGEGYGNWFGAVWESMIYETVVGDAARYFTGVAIPNDPAFKPDLMMVAELAPDLEDIHEDLLTSKSRLELIYRIDTSREIRKHRQKISDTTGGWGAMIVGGLLDPAFLGLTVATWGAGAGVGMGRAFTQGGETAIQLGRLTRTQGAVRGGLIALAADTPLELARAGFSDEWGLEDIPLALALSAGFGGAIGGRWPQTTVSNRWAAEHTQGLMEGRKQALLDGIKDITEEEAEVTAAAWARRQGRVGFGKWGQTKYYDPDRLADEIVGREFTAAVRNGTVRRTPEGEARIPEERPAIRTPEEINEGLQEVDNELSGNSVTRIQRREERKAIIGEHVDGISGKTLKAAAKAEGIPWTKKGRKVGDVRQDLKEALEAKHDEWAVTAQRSDKALEGKIHGGDEDLIKTEQGLKAKKEELLADKGGDDATRRLDDEFNEETGQGFQETLNQLDTYDKHGDKQNWLSKLASWVDNWPLIGKVSSSLLSSSNEGIRRFGTLFATDGLMRNKIPLLSVASHHVRKSMTRYAITMDPLRQRIVKELGLDEGIGGSLRTHRGKVNRLIADAMRSGETPEGALGEAVTSLRKHYSDLLAWGKKKGIFDASIPDDPRYLPRVMNKRVIRMLHNNMMEDGDVEGLTNFIAAALRSGSGDMSDDLSKKLARRWLSAAMDPHQYQSARVKDTSTWRQMDESLRKEFVEPGLLDESQLDDFIEMIAPNKGRSSSVGANRKRLQFDETYADGDVHFGDLLNNNIDELTEFYTRRVLGAGYWRMGVQALDPDKVAGGLDADAGLEGVLGWARRQAKLGKGMTEKEEQGINQLYRAMHSLPTTDTPESVRKTSRMLMDLAYVTNMNQAGFAQVPELITMIAANGLQGIESMGGALFHLRRKMKGGLLGKGELKHDLLAELEAATGLGTDILRRLHITRLEDGLDFAGSGVPIKGTGAFSSRSGLSNAMTRTMGQLRRGTHIGLGFGIGPIDTMLRRAASESSLQHFVNVLFTIDKKGGIGVFKTGAQRGAVRRLKDVGFSDDEIERLIAQLKKPGVVEYRRNYRGSRKVKLLNLDKWDDQGLAERFSFGIYHHVNRVIQRSEVSTLPGWMNHPVGRAIMQFRTFAMTASSKQLGYNLRRLDHKSVQMFVGTTGMGMLTYYAQTYARTIGWNAADREAYLDRALTTDRVVASGFLRAGWTSIFPPVIDQVRTWGGAEGWFSYGGRPSGMMGGMINGIPLVDMIDEWTDIIPHAVGLMKGDEPLTQQTLREISRTLPWQNMMGVSNAVQRGIQETGIPARK